MGNEIEIYDEPLAFTDFDLSRVSNDNYELCPVKGCSEQLKKVPFGRRKDGSERKKLWCPRHHIRLHSGTFVYWHEIPGLPDPRLRNFIVERKLANAIALKAGSKAESHRLGYEMSEDALTWNVFVSLSVAGRLRDTVKLLTDRSVSREPKLFLWGQLIDPKQGLREVYNGLQEVHGYIEKGITRFWTEPDVMLIVDGEMIICIEAKFRSGNPMSHDPTNDRPGEKPTTRAGLISRYLGNSRKDKTKRAIVRASMDDQIHSQLFRNVVFASEMAEKDWHVVNLVSSSFQGIDNRRYSFGNPTAHVQSYLSSEYKHCFTYRTWECLYQALVRDNATLAPLGVYLRGKSAHYQKAFDLSS